jgi:hypothetical protein
MLFESMEKYLCRLPDISVYLKEVKDWPICSLYITYLGEPISPFWAIQDMNPVQSSWSLLLSPPSERYFLTNR